MVLLYRCGLFLDSEMQLTLGRCLAWVDLVRATHPPEVGEKMEWEYKFDCVLIRLILCSQQKVEIELSNF